MSNNIYLAVTGYYCTGSSALLDLLKEYDNVSIASPINNDYEHMVFYSQGALFDLASILLSNNRSPYGSDMAINEFIDSAKRLNDNDFGWYGSYKKYYGNCFMNSVYEFVDEISYLKDRRSAAHAKCVRFSVKKAILQIAAKIVYKRPITCLGKTYVFDNKPSYFSMPSYDEFCRAAKKYTSSYLKMCSKESGINVFDHLIWPQQTNSLNEFMPDNLKVIIVDRDPRDMYLLNKYYWHTPPVSTSKPYYPVDSKTFVEEWKRTIPSAIDNKRVLIIHFEDLIYNYDQTVNQIESFLELESIHHTKKYQFFEPERSIENTQVFNINDEWNKEIQIFYSELCEYLYSFPYSRIPDKKLWFDTELQLVNVKKNKKIVR